MPTSLASDFKLLEQLWREAPRREVLPNGLTVVFKPEPTASVASVQVWVKTGSMHEGDHLGAGLSHYLEHMLFKGTKRRAGREISAEVQTHGGYINAYTSFDRTVYYIDVPSEHAPRAVDILGDLTLRSVLPAEEVTREKDVILREIDMGLDDPDHRLWQALFETAYQRHPMREPIIGHRDVFAATTRPQLLEYYRARYVPNNMVVVIAGGFDEAAVREAISLHFAKTPRRRLAPVYLPAERSILAPRVQHVVDDVEIVRGAIAWHVPGLSHPDAAALNVLALIVGHGDSSLLWRALREKKRLVHSIDATTWAPGDQGLFYVSLACEPAKRDRALAEVAREFQRIAQRGFTATQVRKAIRQLVVGEINGRKTVSGQASRLGVAEVVAGDLAFSRGYFQRLRKVTPAAVRRALQTYLLDQHAATVTLSPKGADAAATASGRAGEAGKPAVLRETLPNGARLLMQPDHRLPNLHLRLLSLGGTAYEAEGKHGSNQLMATLLARDTAKRTASEVATAIETVGGSLSAVTGNNTFGLAVEVLPGDTDLALDLLAEAALKPKFRAEALAIERDAQIAELQQEADDVVAIGRKELRRRFFGDHPLATEALGEIEQLRTLKRRDLVQLHRRLMVAPNVVLSVAGDFDPAELGPKLRRLLRRFRTADFEPIQPAFAHPAETGAFVNQQPREQAVIYRGYPGPGLRSADYHVAEVADELFSGMSSRLFERVREEKGLAYYVRSSRVIGLEAGMFYFNAGTAPGKEREVGHEFDLEIKRMTSGRVTQTELQRCQTRLCAGRRMSLQSNGAKAMHVALNELYGQPLDDGAEFERRIRAVTVKDLAEFGRRYLRPKACTEVVVRP